MKVRPLRTTVRGRVMTYGLFDRIVDRLIHGLYNWQQERLDDRWEEALNKRDEDMAPEHP